VIDLTVSVSVLFEEKVTNRRKIKTNKLPKSPCHERPEAFIAMKQKCV